MSDITVIPGSQCIGDSLATINANFDSLNNFVVTVTTTAILGTASNAINTTKKTIGKLVFASDNNKLYIAGGPNAVSVWYRADGTGNITPA